MDNTSVAHARKKYKPILAKERVVIEQMQRAGCERAEIVRVIGCHARTLKRELARGTCMQRNPDWSERYEYLADYAQMKHEAAGAECQAQRRAGAAGIFGEKDQEGTLLTGRGADENRGGGAGIRACGERENSV